MASRRPVGLAALAATAVLAACGGGSARPAAGPGPGSGPAAAAPHQCASRAAGDPAELMICLAKHGVKVRGDGRLERCAANAGDARTLEACIEASAR